ncbi:uncharacterized protein N7503_010855 [Penicillium pulvis]|uniref:uncharacterized protein n=1 Tax=Penicillium pulvis TaxID=1562058 RepID=UPI00254703F2|nr:uncharacterized protein N7503_010855 [Penicillium pulvis]KAJ5785643.1 hypothetical protein N7503_010855 [Penicillium pulvis]
MPIATRQERELLNLDETLLHEIPIDEFLRDLPTDAAVHDLSLDLVNASTSFQSQKAYGNLGYTGTLPLNTMNYMTNPLPGQIPESRVNYFQPTYHEHSFTPIPYVHPTAFETGFTIQEPMLASIPPTAFGPSFVTAEPTLWSIHPTAFGSSFTTQEPTLASIHPARFEGTPQSHRNNTPTQANTIRCDWQGCTYKGTFGRRAFKCPECGREFNRKENLQGHLESVHMSSRRRR